MFHEPTSGWDAPQYLSFTDTVNAIIVHRQANPRFNLATDRSTVEQELDVFNTERLRHMKGGAAYLASDEPPASFTFPPRQRSRGGAAVVSAKRAAAGIGVIRDWIGDGLVPVAKDLSEHRAQTCLLCPLNQLGNFWQRLEGKAAEAVRELVNAKNEMQLSTTIDASLHVCQACDCFLALKVHVPLEHIKAHTRPEILEKLWSNCWIRHERAAAGIQ